MADLNKNKTALHTHAKSILNLTAQLSKDDSTRGVLVAEVLQQPKNMENLMANRETATVTGLL